MERKRFLILGAAHNPATMVGMMEQSRWLTCAYQDQPFEVDIAGYDTEKLADYFGDRSEFRLHGTIDHDQLRKLMIQTKAILIHQSTGVGALTRIPDMLIAGIPVIANSHACRSAFHYSGVHHYDDIAGLVTLINSNFELPELVAQPIEAEQRFIAALRTLSAH